MSNIKNVAMITVCGRPNVGKSSLTNALVGEKVAIVSNKAQTTRNRIYGVVNREDTQYVRRGTPGLHKPKSALGDYMVKVITSSLSTLDVPQYDSIICSAKMHDEKPDLVVKYIKAFFEACDALQADTDMCAQMLMDWYTENGQETDLESCKTEVESRPFVTSEEAASITVGESVEITGEFWVSQQLLEESRFPEIAAHVDDTLVKEALGF